MTRRIYFYIFSSTIENFRYLDLEKHKNTKKFEKKDNELCAVSDKYSVSVKGTQILAIWSGYSEEVFSVYKFCKGVRNIMHIMNFIFNSTWV